MKSLLLAIVMALPFPALAETREERVAAAESYIDLALADFDMESMIKTLYQPILDQVAAGGVVLGTTQTDMVHRLFMDALAEPLPAVMRDQAGIMADMMTLAEITALTEFTRTPEGKSVMAKLPRLTAAQQPALNAFIGQKMDELVPQVLAIVNGEAPPAPTTQP
ncbi:MAG: hypothetical protein JNK34_12910 [Tabrizicola sp.]|nr:hypothetical protein [Tabrizicola sp.]